MGKRSRETILKENRKREWEFAAGEFRAIVEVVRGIGAFDGDGLLLLHHWFLHNGSGNDFGQSGAVRQAPFLEIGREVETLVSETHERDRIEGGFHLWAEKVGPGPTDARIIGCAAAVLAARSDEKLASIVGGRERVVYGWIGPIRIPEDDWVAILPAFLISDASLDGTRTVSICLQFESFSRSKARAGEISMRLAAQLPFRLVLGAVEIAVEPSRGETHFLSPDWLPGQKRVIHRADSITWILG